MLKLIGGAISGVIAWFVIVTALNLIPRYGWPDYAAVEKIMAFTLPMMVARLSMSGISSFISGVIAARVGENDWAPLVAGGVLVLIFAPFHYSIWDKFPVWYHLTFLVSLPFLSWLGGKFVSRRPDSA